MPETAMVAEKQKKPTLRDLTEELTAWRQTLSASEEETDLPLIRAKLAQITEDHENRTDQWCAFLRWLPHEVAYLSTEALQFTRKARSWERLEEKLRRLAAEIMTNNELDEMRGKSSSMKLMPGKKGKLIIDDPKQLPSCYVRHVGEVIIPAHDEPDAEAIEIALRCGKSVPGARLAEGPPFIRLSGGAGV